MIKTEAVHFFPSPYEVLDPLRYADHLRTTSIETKRRLHTAFCGLPIKNDCCVVVVGSAGKGEGYLNMKPEVEVWQPPNNPSTYLSDLYTKHHGIPFSTRFLVSTNGARAPSPDRVLNTGLVYGDGDVFWRLKQQIIEKIASDSPSGQETRTDMDRQLNSYLQCLQTGKHNGHLAFMEISREHDDAQSSLPDGLRDKPVVQFYDGKHVFGFDPVLKLIQGLLDKVVVDALRNGSLSIEDAIQMPPNTIEKMDLLSSASFIPPIGEVKSAYLWLLKETHRAQDISRRMGDEEIGVRYSPGWINSQFDPIYQWITNINRIN